MKINFKNKEPSQIREKECSDLYAMDKLGVIQYADTFINAVTKNDMSKGNKDNSKNAKSKDLREGIVGVVAPWGSGKSFFLNILFCKMKDDYSIVYMDGSEYSNKDNVELSVLNAIIKSDTVKEKVQKTAIGLLGSFGKVVLKKAASYIDEDTGFVKEALESVGGEVINNVVKSYEETPQEKLKKALGKTAKNNHPIVIIIDNLDRCDADYTLGFLTKIKDVFDIPNLLFIVAYDKMKIKNFVKQKFGDDSSTGFLRKYVVAEFYLPNFEDEIEKAIKYFYDEAGIEGQIFNDAGESESNDSLTDVKNTPINKLAELYKSSALTLRMIEQLIKRASLVIENTGNYYRESDNFTKTVMLFMVIACKYLHEDYYYLQFYRKEINETDTKKTSTAREIFNKLAKTQKEEESTEEADKIFREMQQHIERLNNV